AAFNGHSKVVSALLRNGAKVNVNGADGLTPLMTAAENGHLSTVRVLVEAGADVTARNQKGESALYLAKQHNHQDIAAYLELLDKPAKPSKQTKSPKPKTHHRDTTGKNLLFKLAVIGGNLTQVQQLIPQGVNLHERFHDGSSTLTAAAKSENPDLVRFFVEE